MPGIYWLSFVNGLEYPILTLILINCFQENIGSLDWFHKITRLYMVVNSHRLKCFFFSKPSVQKTKIYENSLIFYQTKNNINFIERIREKLKIIKIKRIKWIKLKTQNGYQIELDSFNTIKLFSLLSFITFHIHLF